MPYIGVVPAITVTSQDAGDVSWQTVSVTDDTTFIVEFPDSDIPREHIVEILNGGAYDITWGDSHSIPIQWEAGVEPTLSVNGKDIIRFFYDGEGEIFGKVVGTDFEV